MEATELTWADRMRAEGIERGIEEGMLRGKRTGLLRVIRGRFGPLPEEIVARVEDLDAVLLDQALDSIAEVGTLDEFLARL